MKKIAIFALGLGIAGQAEAKLNLTLDSGKALMDAVVELPENLKEIEGKVISKDAGLQGISYSLKQNVEALTGYKIGGTFKNAKGKDQKITSKTGALLKTVSIMDILQNTIDFLSTILDINAIIKDRMILPILNVAGEQALLKPLNNMTTDITTFKTKLVEVHAQMKDIFDLISLLVPMPEPKEEVATGGKKK